MFNYCAEENVFKKQEQFNTINDGESIKQTGSHTRKEERNKQKKKGKTKDRDRSDCKVQTFNQGSI